jgi:hypothetical protein
MMIWAVLFNFDELAEYFWTEGGQAIPNALLASRLFEGMANHDALTSKGGLNDRVNRIAEMSDKFEEMAIGVCVTRDGDATTSTWQRTLD